MTQDNPLQQAFEVLAGGGSLSAEAAAAAFGVLMRGEATPVQSAALLVALYFACRWYADLKARRRAWWMAYL